jgi:integral membrane sensor domain MASE1
LIGTIVLNGLVALFAWGLSELVLYPARGGRAVTPIWPPVGLAVALVYIGGFRLLPGIVLGSLALGLRFNAWPLATLLALAQVVQPIIHIRVLKALDFDPRLERVRDPITLSLIAGPAGSLAAALVVAALGCCSGPERSTLCPTTSCCGGCATGSA